jgi:hypothetical protein
MGSIGHATFSSLLLGYQVAAFMSNISPAKAVISETLGWKYPCRTVHHQVELRNNLLFSIFKQ